MMPATNVPCPASRSSIPSPPGVGNASSGSVSLPRGTAASQPSARSSGVMPVSMMATRHGVPGHGPSGVEPGGGVVGSGPPIALLTGPVGVTLQTAAAWPSERSSRARLESSSPVIVG